MISGIASGEFSHVAGEPGLVVPAQHKACAVQQYDGEVAVEKGLHLPDPVDVHDCRAVDSQELRRVEPGFEIIHRLADQM